MFHFIKLKNSIPLKLYLVILLSACNVQQVFTTLTAISSCDTVGTEEVCKNGATDIANGIYCMKTDNGKGKLYYTNNTTCQPGGTGVKLLKYDSGYKNTATADDEEETKYVIYDCNDEECTLYKSNYYVHTFISNTKKLFKTESDGEATMKSSYTVGYYLSGKPNGTKYPSLIHVEDDTSPNFPAVSVSAGYYLAGDGTNKLIKCSGTPVLCEGITTPTDGFYVDATSNNKIFTCKNNSCTSAVALKGIYINAGASNSVITCNTSCSVSDVTATTCSTAGNLIKTTDSKIKLCVSNKADEAKEIKPSSDTFIMLAKGANFLGATTTEDINVKLSINGAAYLLEDANIVTCTETDVSDSNACIDSTVTTQHCITSEKKLLQTSNSNNKCSVATESAGNVFLDNDFKPSTASATFEAKYGYSCNGNSICEIIKGYIIDTNYFVKCSGWKGDPCIGNAKGTTETCTATTIDGELLDIGTKLCFGTNEYELQTAGETIAFHLNDISSNYGKNKDEVVILSASTTQAIVTSVISTSTAPKYFLNRNSAAGKRIIKCAGTCAVDAGKVGYYLDEGTYDGTNIKGLIQCTNPAESDCATISSPVGYFVDAEKGTTGADGKVTYSGLITCDSSNHCSPAASVTEGVYLNGAVDSTDKFKNALIKCTESGETLSCQEISLTPETDNNSIFLTKDKTIIRCLDSSTGGCTELDNTTTYAYIFGTTDIPDYYVNAAADGLTKAIIKCTGTTDKCAAIDALNGDVYFNGNSKLVDTSNTGGIDDQLIICTGTECKTVKKDFSAEADQSKVEYFLNSGDYTYNTVIYPLIKCSYNTDKTTCEKEVGITSKFLINGNHNGSINSYLIKCTSATACDVYASQETKTANAKEYYINGAVSSGLDNAIIEVSFVMETPPANRKRDDTLKAVTNLITPEAGYIYINSEDKNLIQCNTACTSNTSLVGTETAPTYFVNGNPDTEANNFTDRLIKCEGTTKKCSLINGKENGVYINGNLLVANDNANGEDGKRIIICNAKKCKSVADSSAAAIYINGASNGTALTDALIKCGSEGNACVLATNVTNNKVYVNGNFKSDDTSIFTDPSNSLIVCVDNTCQAKTPQANRDNNEFYLNGDDAEANLENDLIICELNTETNKKLCRAYTGVQNKVYIDSYTKGNVIYCTNEKCGSKASFASNESGELSKFYVNGDPIDFEGGAVDKDPLNGDLIKCTKTGTGDNSEISCTVVKGDNDNVYINSNYVKQEGENPVTGDITNQLIICTTENGCLAKKSSEIENDKFPKYYMNSSNPNKLDKGIIECTSVDEACTLKTAKSYEVYKNGNNHESLKPLIKCGSTSCKPTESSATEESNEYFKNAGDTDDKALEYDIIECKLVSTNKVCTEVKEIQEGVYLNSNYAESGDKEQLIKCTSDNGCVGVRSESTSKEGEYYINAEANTIKNNIILCINKKCEKQTPSVFPSFYVGYMKEESDGLIQCLDKEQICEYLPPFTSNGYYINNGYNKAKNQTIICDSTDGCASLNVDLGYYVNAGETDKPIIKCEKEGTECISEASPKCPESEDAVPGNYCYEENQLQFFAATNSTSISASKTDDIYTFANIPDNGFPGIKREIGALFKVSRYFIIRFYQSGVVMIDKNGKLVDSLSADQSDITLYDCNDTTKICSEKPGCTSNTYMYDSENKKAIFCNNGKLEYVTTSGYLVDYNRSVGTNHPYIIKCESNGKCSSLRPKTSSYYENSGYDSTANALIQCSNNNCYTVTAEVGYFVGHDGDGIIQCTSTSSCVFNDVKNSVKYVNAGSNKASYAIIECKRNSKCYAVKAKIGYYMTYSTTLLIQCTSPSSCIEFTPTVNYYDNADSSEGSSTIINCVQTNQVVTCAPEQTNNGFYMSSVPNVLIRCKSGSKCKTVVVKNGIFRGALKGLNGGSKRTDESVIESATREDAEFEENGKVVAMPRDSDEAYGIIRCVAGKCSALSPSEVAAIPMCEFNNNKCYITLEYSMTKTATTSISAGNICTNSDRSVFYFATDTVVVKPNIISGVTTTYVYTTTNSNCLEVNDSYSDMYFTVGSNIYILDQGSVLQFYETGYYFINTAKNALVSGNDIDAYNDANVKLYKCNGSGCSVVDKPESLTYYADVNKRILKYNINNDAYSFAYANDIICIFANNKCTPNADLKNQEFCITYKGELVLAKQDIKNRETGECYKATSISNTIYGYSQHLYSMNIYSAEMVDETGYYIVNLSTNTTVVSKNYKTKNNNLVVYGCQLSSCKEYTPDENTYYYDARAKTILRYRDGVWNTPSASGYAYVSIDPVNTYIYKFTKKVDEVTINGMANYGYYYTIDGEMYHCNRDEDGDCTQIKNTGYYFTNAGEVYYCVHDSEELEPTECTKQACVSGQYYYIDEAYYRCEVNSMLVPVVSRYCSYNDNVIINFPLALTEEFPEKVKQAVEGVEKNNNSTAIVSRRGKNYLESVSGIFTNCTYNVEETKSTFDLVCVNNYVAVDKENDEVKICSMEQLGYVECVEDEENPEKCNVSGSISRLSLSVLSIIFATLLSHLLLNHN